MSDEWPMMPDMPNRRLPDYRVWRGFRAGTADEIHEATHVSVSQNDDFITVYEPVFPDGKSEVQRLQWWAGYTETFLRCHIEIFVEVGRYSFLFNRVRLPSHVARVTDGIAIGPLYIDTTLTVATQHTYEQAVVYLAGLRDYVRFTSRDLL